MTNDRFGKPEIHQFDRQRVSHLNDYFNEIKFVNNFTPPSSPMEDINKPKKKSAMKEYLIEYANASTVHGLSHLVAPRRHFIERLVVTFFIIVMLIFLIILSIDFWDRYQNNPTVIVLDHEYRNFDVSKPSVIICPLERIDEERFVEVFQKYGVKDTEETRKFFYFLSNATYDKFDGVPTFTAVEPKLWLPILYDLKPEVDLMSWCPMNGWIITEKGLCMAFNNYVAPYSTLEFWTSGNWTVMPSPNLENFTYSTREIKHNTNIKSHPVEFTVIHPANVLNLDDKFYTVQKQSIQNIQFLVTEITSSDQVKALSITQRKCKLFMEKGLKLWPVYTHAMCSIECRYRQIYKICKCYPHFARPVGDIPICNTDQLKCINKNLKNIILSNDDLLKECKCWPDCDIAKFTEESSSINKLMAGSPPDAVIKLGVTFPTDKFKRELLFGFNDFLASVGGGAGLFLGASVLSFVEIFYFGTLRLFWYRMKLIRDKKKEKASPLNDNK